MFKRLLHSVRHLLPHILNHPVHRGIKKGDLPRSTYHQLIFHDAYYLPKLKEASEIISAKLLESQAEPLKEASKGITTEYAVHKKYLDEFTDLQKNPLFKQKNPYIDAYVNHLVFNAHRSPPAVSVASLLPCFWIYRELGNQMQNVDTTHHPYRKWIGSYTSQRFKSSTETIIALTNDLGKCATPEVQKQMFTVFSRSTLLEFMFVESLMKDTPLSLPSLRSQ